MSIASCWYLLKLLHRLVFLLKVEIVFESDKSLEANEVEVK